MHAIPGGSTNESRVANRFFLAKNSTKNAFVIGQSVYLLCPFIDGLIDQERGNGVVGFEGLMIRGFGVLRGAARSSAPKRGDTTNGHCK